MTNLKKFVFDNKLVVFGLLLVIIFLVIPFINNPIQSWDSPGHLINSEFINKFTWPNVVVWNPFFFFGYMQNQFYPPLFYFLVSTLGFLVSIDLAYKIIILLSYGVFFVYSYKFLKELEFSGSKSVISILIILIFFSIIDFSIQPSGCLGGTFYSSFVCGLSPSILALALIFVALYFIQKGIKSILSKQNNFELLPGIMFGLAVLSHFTGLIVFLLMGGYLIYFRKNKKITKYILKNLGLGLLLSSFWLIPFIVRLNLSENAIVFFENDLVFYVFTLVFLGVYYFLMRSNSFIKERLTPLYYGNLLILMTLVVLPFFIKVQIFRLLIQFYLFSLLLLVGVIKEKFFSKFGTIIGIVLIIGLLFTLFNFPESEKVNEFNELNTFEGYILPIGTNTNFTAHHLISFYNPYYSNNLSANGLFVEGTRSSVYSFMLKNNIYPSLWWGTTMFIKNENPFVINNQLNILGINYLILPKDTNVDNIKFNLVNRNFFQQVINAKSSNKIYSINYSLYKNSSSQKIVEPLKYDAIATGVISLTRWFNINKINFFDFNNNLFVFSDKNIKKSDKNYFVSDIVWGGDYQSFYFNVDSNKKIPLYVRVSYYPTWKAYSGGEEIPVHWVSPNFMLVEGNGKIEFKQSLLFEDYFGIMLTGLGIIFLLLNFIKCFRK